MKTRIVHTRIWKDSYFRSLNHSEKLFFCWLITNEYVNQIWLYECPDDVISFETSIPAKEIVKIKSKFQNDGKMGFYKSYIYLANAQKYETYTGDKNEVAKEKIVKLLAPDVLGWYMDIIDRGIDTGIDTQEIPSIIHNTENIIQNKGGAGGKQVDEIMEEDLIEISQKYSVPLEFVRSKLDDLENYCKSNGKVYKDSLAALRNWVKRDSLKIRDKINGQIKFIDPS